ncbi:hypothetical protein KIPB_001342, partial [Kipferlia bialata]|eukprot:g1342.t1
MKYVIPIVGPVAGGKSTTYQTIVGSVSGEVPEIPESGCFPAAVIDLSSAFGTSESDRVFVYDTPTPTSAQDKG